jgi:cell division cycle protein 20 (cofactor of APC complex)
MQRSGSDRMIPNRGAMDFSSSLLARTNSKENQNGDAAPATRDPYRNALTETMGDKNCRIMAYKSKPKAATAGGQNLSVLYSHNRTSQSGISKKTFRHISQTPERILDAPDLLDDYYLNLMAWSSQNILAVALGPAVYLWNATDGSIDMLCDLAEADEEDYVCSVDWTADGKYLSVGTASSVVQIWDIEHKKQLRSMASHSARVSALAWNGHMLASGSRDSAIHNHDVRIQNHKIATMAGHTQEVCGLKWSPNGETLASGANDNLVCLWSPNAATNGVCAPSFRLTEHQAAVKALAWCPHEPNTLATGGGTADRMIRFWDTDKGICRNSIDTGSQVCALVWSPHEKEIVSSHGYAQNQLCLWKYPTMTKAAELTGHSARVLHMAVSPDGETVCSGAADETLRFWKIFAAPEKKGSGSSSRSGKMKSMSSIR